MQTQIFGYVFALVVAALILIFGFKVLGGVNEQTELSRYAEFKEELKADIVSTSLLFGSTKRATYAVPGSVSEVCFYAPTDSISTVDDSCQTTSDYPLVKDSIEDNSGNNVFVLGELPEAFYLPYVDTGVCPLRCFEIRRGEVTILLEGKDNRTLILS